MNKKKFDICLMNPPYGMRTDTIHLKFVDKILDICDKEIVIMPFKFITKDHNCYKKYKESNKWNNKLSDVEEIDSKLFIGTAMENIAIYTFDNKDQINIKTINGKYDQRLHQITDYKETSEYDDEILKYLYNDHISNNIVWGGGFGSNNKNKFIRQGYSENEAEELVKNEILKNCKNIKKLNKNVYLILSHVINENYPKYYTDSSGLIFKDIKDIEAHALKYKYGKGFEIMGFNSYKEAQNCKDALNRPLLRFGLINAHPGLDVVPRKSYRYVPDIDWSDKRVKTDEGLLEVCGCPKNKAKEYAEYCKKIIDEVNKK